MKSPLLHLERVVAGYGALTVLHQVSLTVCEGEIVTIIGANGAGKTTTLMAISGVRPLSSGGIVFDGREIHRKAAHQIVHDGIAHVPEGRKVFPRMSVLENLELGAFLRRDRHALKPEMERLFEIFPVLGNRLHQAAGTLSGGEQQMLAIARALMSKPRLLLLDEPSMGIAPLIVQRIFEVLRDLNREGMTILLVEQNANLALKLASRGYVMETGRIRLTDTAEALLSNTEVQKAYLGH